MLLHNESEELYQVSFLSLQPYDVEENMIGWDNAFDWTIYFGTRGVEVYKMVITGNDEIQGAIALEIRQDHVYVHLIESAPHNRFDNVFDYVGEHLIAFACQRSRDLGFGGAIAFQSKTKARLLWYYTKTIGAQHLGNGLMIIHEAVANKLIMLYLS